MKASFFITSIFLFFAILVFPHNCSAQETLKISLSEFIDRALENSGKAKFEFQDVELAENRVLAAKSKRILPKIDFSSQHGLVPGVTSDSLLPNGRPLPEDEFYLDPDLENDWNNWAVFTRAEITAVQPVFTWGAINKAIEAARSGATVARQRYKAEEADIELRLFDLYYSYVLALEIERLLNEADEKIKQVDEGIESAREDEEQDVDESDVFKFKVFKAEFQSQRDEVIQRTRQVRELWEFVLKAEPGVNYQPENQFLDPVPANVQSLNFYVNAAQSNRPELKAAEAGIDMVSKAIEAKRAEFLPALFLGLTARFAHTPNRPRQDNPFIINSTNFADAGFGFSIRQNLNFTSLKSSIQRAQIERRKVHYLKDAAMEGIMLEINKSYTDAALAKAKLENQQEALVITKQWVRAEELDYDFGFGEVKDLLDAVKKELEIKLKLLELVFDFNSNMAKLHKAAGFPVNTLLNQQ